MIGSVLNLPGNVGNTFTTVATGAWILSKQSEVGMFSRLSAVGGTATVEFHHTNDPGLTPNASTLLATATLSGVNDFAIASKLDATGLYKCAKCTAISGGAIATAALSV